MRPQARLDVGLALLWGAVLVWAPLPFGSIGEDARSALVIVTFGMLVVTLWRPTPQSRRQRSGSVELAALALCGVALVGGLQILPVFDVSLELEAFEQEWQTDESLGRRSTLSVAPGATVRTVTNLLGAVAALLLTARLAVERLPRRILLSSVVLGAVFQIAYGSLQWLQGNERIWGVEAGVVSARLRGTYVNPNHLAFYLLAALSLALAWLLAEFLRRRADVNERLVGVAMPAALWLVLMVGVAVTGSRGGLLAAGVGFCVQVLLAPKLSRRRESRSTQALWLLPAAAAIVVVVFGSRRGWERVLSAALDPLKWTDRLSVYRSTVELWAEAPLLGHGLGTFRDAFPRRQHPDLWGEWWHAHSDVLELLATGGVVGFLFFILAAVLIVKQLLRGLRRGARREDRLVALACLGALAAWCAHSVVDFGLTLPANWLTVSAVVGAGCAVRLRTQVRSRANSD